MNTTAGTPGHGVVHRSSSVQSSNPQSIWYEAVTGIWQTVWLESVPAVSIAGRKVMSDIDAEVVHFRADYPGLDDGLCLRIVARDGEEVVARAEGLADTELILNVPQAKLWSPDNQIYALIG